MLLPDDFVLVKHGSVSRGIRPRPISLAATDRVDDMADGFQPAEEIDLRWTLRDIRSRRFMIASISAETIQKLSDLGLIEMQGDQPVLTEAGLAKIEQR